jgi:hypothetical protein
MVRKCGVKQCFPLTIRPVLLQKLNNTYLLKDHIFNNITTNLYQIRLYHKLVTAYYEMASKI